jgi:hypothetical protein
MRLTKQTTITLSIAVIAATIVLFASGPLVATHQAVISAGFAGMGFAQTVAPTSNVTLTTPAAPITLGNVFYKETGKVNAQRALDTNGALFEDSYSANGTLNGSIPVMNIGTITVTPRGSGVFLGQGHGVMMSRTGDIATWTSQGIAHIVQGKVIAIGSAIFGNESSGNLAFLNNKVGVFKQIVDQGNNVSSKVWGLS